MQSTKGEGLLALWEPRRKTAQPPKQKPLTQTRLYWERRVFGTLKNPGPVDSFGVAAQETWEVELTLLLLVLEEEDICGKNFTAEAV